MGDRLLALRQRPVPLVRVPRPALPVEAPMTAPTPGPLAVKCPYCGRAPGRMCASNPGAYRLKLRDPHLKRIAAAQKAREEGEK